MNLMVLLASILFAFSLCFATFILYMHSKRKSTPDIGLIELLFLANFFYMVGYALELISQDVVLKLLFNHMQYMGIPFIVPLWFMICVRFCYQDFKWTLPKTALVLIIPVTTFVMNLTHTMNGMLYSSYATETWNRLMVVIFQKGPWYYVDSVWRIAVLSITIWLFIRTYRRAEGIRKRQAFMLLVLSACAMAFSVSPVVHTQTSGIDLAVLLISVSAILMFTILFKYSLFDLVPLAYSKLFDGMDYPALVLSDSMIVIKTNKAAAELFPQVKDGRCYVPFRSLFASERDLSSRLVEKGESLVEVGADPAKRFFSAKLTRLNLQESIVRKDYGYLLVLSDVTSHVNLARDLKVEASVDR